MNISASENRSRRIFWVVIGNLMLGIGTAMLRLSSFGTDPFSCMNLGVSSHLPLSYGTYQMLFNIALFIPIFIADRKSFGIGALINMLLLGYMVDWSMSLFALFGLTIDSLFAHTAARILFLILGVLIICLGVAVYMQCDLGAAPYDQLAVEIERFSGRKIPFRWARVGYDLIAIAIGFFCGSVVGIATIIIGFFTGPLVNFMRKTIAVRLIGE